MKRWKQKFRITCSVCKRLRIVTVFDKVTANAMKQAMEQQTDVCSDHG